MNLLLVPTLLLFLNQPAAPGMHELTLHVSDVGDVLYGLSIPKDYDPHRPSPLVLARHPGGSRRGYAAAHSHGRDRTTDEGSRSDHRGA